MKMKRSTCKAKFLDLVNIESVFSCDPDTNI